VIYLFLPSSNPSEVISFIHRGFRINSFTFFRRPCFKFESLALQYHKILFSLVISYLRRIYISMCIYYIILFKCCFYLVCCPDISTLSLRYCSNYNFVGSVVDVTH
jgi:hypothetical protein